MNCPYKSMDEEEDHGSSWKRELEGGQGTELARPAFHYFAEDDEDEQASGGLNRLASRNAGGAQRTWKKATVVVDSGAAENVMPRIMCPEIPTEDTERSKNGKPGGEHIENYGQQVMSVRIPEGFVRKSTWQVGDVRRLPVSASHIIQAGNDLFIGRDEAYIMNSKKKEKSVHRNEWNVYVLHLFVKVPSGAVAPINYRPMEVDAINQVADGRDQRKRVTFDCNNPTFLRQEE